METKFVWRIEEPLTKKHKVYVAKVICHCQSSSGVKITGENFDTLCRDCNRIIPTENDDVQVYSSNDDCKATFSINDDNEIEIVFPDYPSKVDEARELMVKYEREHYCQCETPQEQTAMFEVESVCIRCEKIIKKV